MKTTNTNTSTETKAKRVGGNPGNQRSFSPKGCTKTVLTTLQPAEFQELDEIAINEARTRSAAARLLLLAGLRQYRIEQRLQVN